MPRHMLEVKEAAEYLHISPWTLYDKAKKGLIPCVHVGRRVLFSQEGLDEWFAEQERLSVTIQKPSTKTGKSDEPNFGALSLVNKK